MKNDLRSLYHTTGVIGKPVTFMINESHIVDERWLVYINDLLTSGEIPDLFDGPEKDNIYTALRFFFGSSPPCSFVFFFLLLVAFPPSVRSSTHKIQGREETTTNHPSVTKTQRKNAYAFFSPGSELVLTGGHQRQHTFYLHRKLNN